MKKITKLTLILGTSLATLSCGDKEKPNTHETSAVNQNAIESLIVSSAPENALPISEIRKSTKVGKEVTLSGVVMGRMDPFVDGRALVMLGDPAAITTCNLRPGDNCETPWDVCCDDPEVIAKSVATIQVLNDQGIPLKQNIKGVKGIKELSSLIVTGIIAEGSNDKNLLVNASSIYIQP